jgi:hypothetical protein
MWALKQLLANKNNTREEGGGGMQLTHNSNEYMRKDCFW